MKDVIYALILRDAKTKFTKSIFSYYWLLIEPLLHIIIYITIFSLIRTKLMINVNYEIFLLIGLIPFFLFRNIINKTLDIIKSNKNLFIYKRINLINLILSKIIFEYIIYTILYIVLLYLFALYFEYTYVIKNLTNLIFYYHSILLVSFILSFLLAILVEYNDKIKIFIKTYLTILYFTSAIIYPIHMIPSEYQKILLYFNPILPIIEKLKENLILGYSYTLDNVIYNYEYYYIMFFLILLYITLKIYLIQKR